MRNRKFQRSNIDKLQLLGVANFPRFSPFPSFRQSFTHDAITSQVRAWKSAQIHHPNSCIPKQQEQTKTKSTTNPPSKFKNINLPRSYMVKKNCNKNEHLQQLVKLHLHYSNMAKNEYFPIDINQFPKKLNFWGIRI